MELLSRRRFELFAIAMALLLGLLHVWADAQPAVGLVSEESQRAGPVGALLRGVQFLEGRATDLKFWIRGTRSPHPDVVVVAIDERSVEAYGRWPWARDRMAQAIDALDRAGVRSVGLDIAFTDEAPDALGAAYRQLLDSLGEPPPGVSPSVLVRWNELRQSLSAAAGTPDRLLEEALGRAPQVVQGVIAYPESEARQFSEDKRDEQAKLLERYLLKRVPGAVPGSFFDIPIDQLRSYRMHSAQTPLSRFVRPGAHLGHFNFVPDSDGTMRRTPIFAKLEAHGGLLPSLGLQTTAVYLGATVEPAFSQGRLLGARLRTPDGAVRLVPYQNDEPYTRINYYGPASVFPTLSVREIMEGGADPSSLRGKLAFVGLTIAGNLGDQRVTPFRELEPGVYQHATLASNILLDDYLHRPVWMAFLEVLLMVAFALGLAVFIPRARSFTTKGLLIVAVSVLWLVASQWAFGEGLEVAVTLPLVSHLGCAFGLIFIGYLSVDREKLKLRQTFSRYLGEQVMEEALAHPEKLMRGEKREMTVLFSDIRGFTTLAERMVPETLADFINEYLSPMTQLVFDEQGTLDKYIGDAVMAFWNAPLDQPDHPLRACRAALRMQERLEELKQKWRAEGYPEFDIGVGISSGPMIVGNMGSEIRVDYTVMGDTVNLGSRLEGTNKEFDTRIIISENTYQAVKAHTVCRWLGAVRVKGKRQPVRIYELRAMGQPKGTEAEAIATFEKALEAYSGRAFEEAERLFQQAAALWGNDPPSDRYLQELELFKTLPPGSGWDGVCGFGRK